MNTKGIESLPEWKGQVVESHPVEMPLSDYVIQVVELTVAKAVPATVKACFEEHLKTCPKTELLAKVEKLDDRVDKIEVRFATLIGLMIGSGTCGGAISGVLVHFLGG